MTKASVVILTRNSEDWLIDVLESVSAQTCPRDWLETIIIDQGSTDATTALARFYLARHGMRGGLHTADPAMGLAGAMNVGWQTAAGDWIQVIKSPGRLAPDKLQVQLDFLHNSPNPPGRSFPIGSCCRRTARFGLPAAR